MTFEVNYTDMDNQHSFYDYKKHPLSVKTLSPLLIFNILKRAQILHLRYVVYKLIKYVLEIVNQYFKKAYLKHFYVITDKPQMETFFGRIPL